MSAVGQAEPKHRAHFVPDGRNAAVGAWAIADDGTRIYFDHFSPNEGSAGRGGRYSEDPSPALLVMGLGANGRLWAPAVRRLLASGHEVIVVDNRGCGRSSTPWRPWTTRTMASDAVAVLNELDVERVHVGGASLGGMVAQEIALEFPERVRTLVLSSTTGGFRRLHLAPRKGLRHTLDAMLRSLRPARDPERRVIDFLRTVASEDFTAQCQPGDEAWDTVAAMLEDPVSQRGLTLQLLACMRHSTWSRLARLRIPVQVHHGSEDTLIPPAAGRELARRIPGARFEVHTGAAHALFERMEEVGESIITFLAAAEGRSVAA